MHPRSIAKRLVAAGHPPIHFSSIARFIDRVQERNPGFESPPSGITITHREALEPASRAFREHQAGMERDLEQLVRVEGELLYLAKDDDTVFYETGPIIIKDGQQFRQFTTDKDGARIRLTGQETSAQVQVRKTRIQALLAVAKVIEVRASIHGTYAKLETLVKNPIMEQLRPGEADAMIDAANEMERAALEAGDEKIFSVVLSRVRSAA